MYSYSFHPHFVRFWGRVALVFCVLSAMCVLVPVTGTEMWSAAGFGDQQQVCHLRDDAGGGHSRRKRNVWHEVLLNFDAVVKNVRTINNQQLERIRYRRQWEKWANIAPLVATTEQGYRLKVMKSGKQKILWLPLMEPARPVMKKRRKMLQLPEHMPIDEKHMTQVLQMVDHDLQNPKSKTTRKPYVAQHLDVERRIFQGLPTQRSRIADILKGRSNSQFMNILPPRFNKGILSGDIYAAMKAASTTAKPMKLSSIVSKQRSQAAASIMEFKFNMKRVRVLSVKKNVPNWSDGIIYWTFRDERVHDNWALLYAQKLALVNKVSLHIIFCRLPNFLGSTLRQFNYMFQGLEELESECNTLNIQFHFLIGSPADILPNFVRKHKLGAVVVDFMPLREHVLWTKQLAERLGSEVPVVQVDAHNVVPCWQIRKQQHTAAKIRLKLFRRLKEFLTEFPPVIKHPYSGKLKAKPTAWNEVDKTLQVNRTVLPIADLKAGYETGMSELDKFLKHKLSAYNIIKRDPVKDGLSKLSPWLHFGQIAPQRCVLEAYKYSESCKNSVVAFRDEVLVMRELSDNFCYFNENYDKIEGGPEWAQKTLNEHRKDKREFAYTIDELEKAQTHDILWNAAQLQLVNEGLIHSYARMYWGKKVLEWTDTPETALSHLIYLNNKYAIDGCDPAGYAGFLWSVCGLYDRIYDERKIYGKIRQIQYLSCQKAFLVRSYANRHGAEVHKYSKKEKS